MLVRCNSAQMVRMLAWSSDYICKQMLAKIGSIKDLKLRIFPYEDTRDQLPWVKGGLSFGSFDLLYGSCDAVWYREERWKDPINELWSSNKPIIAVESTLALERGSSGSAQYQRFFHALGAVKCGVLGVYYLRKRGPSVSKMRYDLPKAALNASAMHNCSYLIINDITVLEKLVKFTAYNMQDQVTKLISEIRRNMENYWLSAFNKNFGGDIKRYFESRSIIEVEGGYVKLLATNYRNLTEASLRAGHITLGEFLMAKYMTKGRIFLFLPRLSPEEIVELDASDKKEWKLIRADPDSCVVTMEDFNGINNTLMRRINAIKDSPILGQAIREKNLIMEELKQGLKDGTITLKDHVFANFAERKKPKKTKLSDWINTEKGKL